MAYGAGTGGYIVSYLDTSIVPVELLSFTGTIENNIVILTWQTASEFNNRGFQIEKSFDKKNWFAIGLLMAMVPLLIQMLIHL